MLFGCSSQPPESPNCEDAVEPASPIDYARRQLDCAGATDVTIVLAGDPAAAGVAVDSRPESFAIVPGSPTLVVGRDEVGAMYGALELAEQLRDGGTAQPLARAPSISVRAANLFLVLPALGESWWFRDVAFWREYLGLLARSHLNLLDLHGMYNLDNTQFPNALLYFANSASHPEVGAPDRAANLAMLQTIVKMAEARGIRVALMTYRSDTSLSGSDGGTLAGADLELYVREAAADLAARVPGLDRMGFRIGESGRDASWYRDTFVAGVRAAAPRMKLYTRSWGTTKADLLALIVAGGDDWIVEAKYNGEQLGAPWVIAGGAMVERGWTNYSYEDYLTPPEPYGFVFQVRAGGTHRMFRQASYVLAARAAPTFALAGARGFTLEAAHAYQPQRDFYHADADRYSPWTFRRDELMYLLYGRLAYDPATPEAVFRAALRQRTGTDALWEPVQAASQIVPWIQLAHTCGPDQRDDAPELEWGGPVGYWAQAATAAAPAHSCSRGYHGPFDSFAVAGAADAAADLAAGRPTSRTSPIDVANLLADAAARARMAGALAGSQNAEARDVARECVALADLGDAFAHRLRAETALAVFITSGDEAWRQAARDEATLADAAWKALADDTGYIAAFDEPLRMGPLGLRHFHWRDEIPWLADDASSIDGAVAIASAGSLPASHDFLYAARGAGPTAEIDIAPPDPNAASWTVTARFAQPAGATAVLWWKPFSGLADWRPVPMAGDGTTFSAQIVSAGPGAMFAVEAGGRRFPDAALETPYVTVSP
jgi:hypothetical protein